MFTRQTSGLCVVLVATAVVVVGGAASASGSAASGNRVWKLVYKGQDSSLRVVSDGEAHASLLLRHPEWQGNRDYPAWSPDGRAVAYSQAGRGLFVSQGASTRRITREAVLNEIAWSPDGRFLAFSRSAHSRSAQSGSGIYVIPRQGGGRSRCLLG